MTERTRKPGRWIAAIVAVLVLASCASTPAADPTGTVFDRLTGDWRGEGTLLGRDARFTMTWRPHRDFAVLTFGNGFVDPDGGTTPVLNAAAVYRTTADNPEAVWLDSRGVRIEIRWEASGSTLVAHWTAPTERGRSTYRTLGPDRVEVVDEVLSGDEWRVFGTARLSRVSGPEP